jgi:hypothetical protein
VIRVIKVSRFIKVIRVIGVIRFNRVIRVIGGTRVIKVIRVIRFIRVLRAIRAITIYSLDTKAASTPAEAAGRFLNRRCHAGCKFGVLVAWVAGECSCFGLDLGCKRSYVFTVLIL